MDHVTLTDGVFLLNLAFAVGYLAAVAVGVALIMVLIVRARGG